MEHRGSTVVNRWIALRALGVLTSPPRGGGVYVHWNDPMSGLKMTPLFDPKVGPKFDPPSGPKGVDFRQGRAQNRGVKKRPNSGHGFWVILGPPKYPVLSSINGDAK